MKIALAQLNPTLGAFEKNLAGICAAIARARELGAELLVFPELSLSGYCPRDLLERADFIAADARALQRLCAESKGLAVLVGHLAPQAHNGAKALYNAASLIVEGRIVATYAKQLLPTYDVFDEARYFASGQELGVVNYKGLRLGISICEDVWAGPQGLSHYALDPLASQARNEAQLFINLSASPYAWSKPARREALLAAQAATHKIPLLFCNQVGAHDELIFDGRSVAFNAQGQVVARAAAFAEDLIVIDTDALAVTPPLPLAQASDFTAAADDVAAALRLGLSDYLRKCGFQRVVLGLSGGIDSALTAVLAVQALGAEQVTVLLLPSRYTSQASLDDAASLARNLGVRAETISIEPIFAQSLTSLQPVLGERLQGVTAENLQARIRGQILMAYANAHNALLLTTGNKSELAVGYCTLYGDMCGALNPIADLYKTQVYALAQHLNKNNLIPERILTRAPSAELREGQTDQDSLPPYPLLDALLAAHLEDGQAYEDLLKAGYDETLLKDVLRKVRLSEYKRQQACLGLRVSEKAFGLGRRYPIASVW